MKSCKFVYRVRIYKNVNDRAEGGREGRPAGAELDLLLLHKGERVGVEFERADAPAMTRSLHVAREDLKLSRAWIVHPGTKRYPLHDRGEALPIGEIPDVFTASR